MPGAKVSKSERYTLIVIVCIIITLVLLSLIVGSLKGLTKKTIRILSSYENANVEKLVTNYAKKNKIKVEFTYMGDLAIVDELNSKSDNYDAVWISNSMWLYMLDNSYLTSDSKSISISPVVFGIKESKAKGLGLVNKDVTNTDILELIKNKQIKYVMSSVTQTNTGATAYMGFLESLAGNPEVLTEDLLKDEALIENVKTIFSGVERVSGDESYLNEMFLNSDEYDSVIASESSLIAINKELERQGKETLYLIYPTDGVAINDSTFAFIDNGLEKEEYFLKIQEYLLSKEGQTELAKTGIRTWYGGTDSSVDKKTFNPDWGIDTTKSLNVTRFPSKRVIDASINLYIEELRKPTHVVFCLDYSGSMNGSGIDELVGAMEYILDYEQASADKIQFSKGDKITVIPFATKSYSPWETNNGHMTDELLANIKEKSPRGSTALYDALIDAIDILEDESDDYTKTIIAMTDGEINIGSFSDLKKVYNKSSSKVPIYSITFGDAVVYELQEIADLTNAKVFDGVTDLLGAFKEVRGYN